MASLTVPGSATPGGAVAGSADPGFPVPPGPLNDYVTLDDTQTITGPKTFTSGVIIDVPSGPGLTVSIDGTDTSNGAVLFHQDRAYPTAWFGIYDPGNALYYGVSQALPSPSGTATIGGYYSGMGVGTSTAGNNPVFGVVGYGQSGNGRGSVAFTVYGGNGVETYNTVLDDAHGNMILGGGLSAAVTTVTGNYAVTATDSTVLLNGSALTATLPTAAGATGRMYTVKLIHASTTATVATTSSQTIDGSATCSLSAQYKYVTVQSDGSNWFITANN